ncbi:hypothetical protein [Priestia megaterium]|uniref:hypothetical protein n=1 Tax=Priestia megaterium TaxID=1404 RepID=UPI00112A1635|nr:hypothetical protein [Priestia megaterium]TPF18074.1 hypothetical protein CBE78_02265 [Priestia megaterium]TPF22181.1 hypothetical protein CBE79_04770 [Priestia megaterium]
MNLTKEDKKMVINFIMDHHADYKILKAEHVTYNVEQLKSKTTETLLDLFYHAGGASLYTQEELI